MQVDISFKLPTSWAELKQEDLEYIYRLMAEGMGKDKLRCYFFIRYNAIEVVSKGEDGWNVIYKGIPIFIQQWQLLSCLSVLECLGMDMPDAVVNISKLHGCKSVNPYLFDTDDDKGLTFEQYMDVDAEYQMYLQDKDVSHVLAMVGLLYPGYNGDLEQWEIVAVMYWWISLKDFLKKQYSNLFIASENTEAIDILAAVNGQMRALTGGDVTKENAVNNINVHRALTELDAKALEIQELKERSSHV